MHYDCGELLRGHQVRCKKWPSRLEESREWLSSEVVSNIARVVLCNLNRGLLLITEVKSRFDPANGGADPDQFVKALKALGFQLVSQV